MISPQQFPISPTATLTPRNRHRWASHLRWRIEEDNLLLGKGENYSGPNYSPQSQLFFTCRKQKPRAESLHCYRESPSQASPLEIIQAMMPSLPSYREESGSCRLNRNLSTHQDFSHRF